MNLFIDAISSTWSLVLFNDKIIIDMMKIEMKWKEYDNLLEKIEELLIMNSLAFTDISWIVVINWPGSFTWTRVITLIANTLSFVFNIKIESIDYFRFLETAWWLFPMMIKANRNEYLVKLDSNASPEIKNISEINDLEYFWIWDKSDFENRNIYIKSINDYSTFFKSYRFNWNNERIEPLYIKKPNIT